MSAFREVVQSPRLRPLPQVWRPKNCVFSALLHLIPAVSEPFERVIVDCVGPLPKDKTGHQFLLMLKCAATRFPEAGPLRRISAPLVINTLTKFFTTFWSSGIKHIVANAYHSQYQGALEQWHQTLGSKLQKYCLNTSKYLDEEVPMVVFAIQESLFGHSLGA